MLKPALAFRRPILAEGRGAHDDGLLEKGHAVWGGPAPEEREEEGERREGLAEAGGMGEDAAGEREAGV